MRYLVVMLFALAACQAAPLPAVTPAVSASTLAAAPGGTAGPTAPSPGATAAPSPAPAASCQPTTSLSTVVVAGRTIPVDLAFTSQSRTRGLSGRPCLAKDTGLVLGWDTPTMTRIWMPDMNFAIDVIFVRAGKVIMIYADAQPCAPGGPCPTFGPDEAVDYVLEVPAGSAKAWGLEKGAAIVLHR